MFQAIGAASVCWESMEGTGVFDSDRAKQIGEKLLEFIRQNTQQLPLLGLATTRELIEELRTRMEITQRTVSGHEFGMLCAEALRRLDQEVLDYRTANL